MPIKYPSERGPYLVAAFLCEKILVEQDGVKSAIRIIDRIQRRAVGPNPPEEMEPFNYNISMFVRFKSGSARGSGQLQIQPIKPSGEALTALAVSVFFEGEEDRGFDFAGPISITLDQTGIWWFKITLDNSLVTMIPFRVIYSPQIIPTKPGGRPPLQE
jgi:hypothetical protein